VDPRHDTLPPEAADPTESALKPLADLLEPARRRVRRLVDRVVRRRQG
jgi:hypothetical protein